MRTGAARWSIGNFHEAGFYASDEEFLALILPFVNDGLDADEPVVIGYDRRKCDLLGAALRRRTAVNFIADKSLYASPARAIDAYRRQFDRYLAAGARQIRIAGDVPHEGNGGSFTGWDRYESAVNVVWQAYPVWSRCLYDANTVPERVRDVVERSHPRLVTADGDAGPNSRYQDVAHFQALPVAADPLESVSPAVVLIDPSQEQVRDRLAQLGQGRVGIVTLNDLLFAATEAVLNTEQHGQPPSTVTIWTGPDRIVVRIHDTGPGPADPLAGLVPADAGRPGPGLGLWLSHQLTHVDVTTTTAPEGFTVRLCASLPPDGHTDGAADTRDFHAGTRDGVPIGVGGVHAIDGDGSSLCDQVVATDMVELAGVLWSDLAVDHRCGQCGLIMAWYRIGYQ